MHQSDFKSSFFVIWEMKRELSLIFSRYILFLAELNHYIIILHIKLGNKKKLSKMEINSKVTLQLCGKDAASCITGGCSRHFDMTEAFCCKGKRCKTAATQMKLINRELVKRAAVVRQRAKGSSR